MLTIKTNQMDSDFRDVNARRLHGILLEKKNSIDQAIAMIEAADKSLSLDQLIKSVPLLDTHLSYILGENWFAQANNQILET